MTRADLTRLRRCAWAELRGGWYEPPNARERRACDRLFVGGLLVCRGCQAYRCEPAGLEALAAASPWSPLSRRVIVRRLPGEIALARSRAIKKAAGSRELALLDH